MKNTALAEEFQRLVDNYMKSKVEASQGAKHELDDFVFENHQEIFKALNAFESSNQRTEN